MAGIGSMCGLTEPSMVTDLPRVLRIAMKWTEQPRFEALNVSQIFHRQARACGRVET